MINLRLRRLVCIVGDRLFQPKLPILNSGFPTDARSPRTRPAILDLGANLDNMIVPPRRPQRFVCVASSANSLAYPVEGVILIAAGMRHTRDALETREFREAAVKFGVFYEHRLARVAGSIPSRRASGAVVGT